jgi:hypothetical protein
LFEAPSCFVFDPVIVAAGGGQVLFGRVTAAGVVVGVIYIGVVRGYAAAGEHAFAVSDVDESA